MIGLIDLCAAAIKKLTNQISNTPKVLLAGVSSDIRHSSDKFSIPFQFQNPVGSQHIDLVQAKTRGAE